MPVFICFQQKYEKICKNRVITIVTFLIEFVIEKTVEIFYNIMDNE